MAIPNGITKEHVIQALAEIDAGLDHPFREGTEYELVHEGKLYPPKVVIGVAARFVIWRMLTPKDDFSGEQAAGQANAFLRELGFEVRTKSTDWDRNEVRIAVSDYFEMLRLDLTKTPYNKTEHRKRLIPQLQGRSDGSVEFKHQNISAVLVNMGLPYIDGYKPRGNYQSLLAESVSSFLADHPDFLDGLVKSPVIDPPDAPQKQIAVADVFEQPPDLIEAPDTQMPSFRSRRGRKIDFARRDAQNRRLGKLGERFALDVEKRRQLEAGRDDLASKIEWVSEGWGDGAGFDILSFREKDESERFVEVKTTGLGKFFPFYVTANEVRCSEKNAAKYQLYRVFDFSKSARLYVLDGALTEACRLEAVQY